ncbi:MAG: hypothetical protein ACHREM_04605 [Polyangiales bacterium]
MGRAFAKSTPPPRVGHVGKAETVSVYYGDKKRWDYPALERVQEALGRESDGFDGLQADFEFDTKDEALAALLKVRALGMRAETNGIGDGPSRAAIAAARKVMSKAFERTMGPRSRVAAQDAKCWACGSKLLRHTAIRSTKSAPVTGDVSVCAACSRVLVFDVDLPDKTRPMTEAELDAMDDASVRELAIAINAANASQRDCAKKARRRR